MSSDVIDKVKQLPPDKQKEVEDFIEYLLNKYQITKPEEDLAVVRKNNLGWAKDKVWMADDFNETPEDFKEYL